MRRRSEYETSASSLTACVKRDSVRDVRNVYRVTKREVRAIG
jgi:hypothetical protein